MKKAAVLLLAVAWAVLLFGHGPADDPNPLPPGT
jgi:hypothetical protein